MLKELFEISNMNIEWIFWTYKFFSLYSQAEMIFNCFLLASMHNEIEFWATNYQPKKMMSMAEFLLAICAYKEMLIYKMKNDCNKEKVGVALLRSKWGKHV